MKVKRFSGLLTGSMLFVTCVASASMIDSLTDTLAEKGVISYGEAQQIKTESLEEARRELGAGQASTLPAWIQNIAMKGDLRLRHQIDWSNAAAYPRIRERLRLRVGFDTRVADGLKAGFGLATGQEKSYSTNIAALNTNTDTGFIADGEPTSTNWTFGYGFAKPVVMIDYAFLEYETLGFLRVTGGKMRAGTQVWNATDLLWDTDVNPDGVAVTAGRNLSDTVNVFLTGSWVTWNADKAATTNTPAPDAYIAQPGVTWKPNANIDLKAALAYQQFNVKGKNLYLQGTPAFDYLCWNPSVSLTLRDVYAGYTAAVFGDVVQNNDTAVKSDNMGSSYGVRLGNEKIAKFGDWQLVYMQRTLQANSWINKLGDSDAYGGAVNSTGYEAIATVCLTPSTSLGVDYYNMDKATGATKTTPASLVQIDLVYKF